MATIQDSGVVTVLSRQSVVLPTTTDAGIVTVLPRVSSTVTDYYLAAQPSGDLITESGNTLITESGDTLITET